MKTCIKCNIEYPATTEFFYKSQTHKDGLINTCKKCKSIISKDYQTKNAEEIKAQRKKYYHENIEKVKESQLRYRLNNHEKVKEMTIRWRAKNQEHIAEYYRKKYGRNERSTKDSVYKYRKKFASKDEALLHEKKSKVLRNQKRRSLAKELESNFSLEQWQDCKEFFDNKCCYCGKSSDKLQQEHFISIKHGGEYTIRNIIPACNTCNIKKRDKNFFEWYPKQEFYSPERQSKILCYLSIQEGKYKEAE
jgi:hypothetical protein